MGRGGGSSGGGFCSRSREVGGGRISRRRMKTGWRKSEGKEIEMGGRVSKSDLF